MAFHHHHHQDHQPNTISRSCFCSSQIAPPPSYTPPSCDPFLITSIVSQLLQNQNPQTQNFYSQHIKSTNINPKSKQCIFSKYPHQEADQFQPHFVYSSLLQRIDALEESLHQFSSSSLSLRDAAARVIQTHFRAYLVRRSRTLRTLKDLASIKSRLISLKSSLSHQGFVDFDSLSRKAMDLLLKLDSFQDGDLMIGESKRSITREIIQFLELVDGVCVKRFQVLTKTMKNMRLARNDSRLAHDGREYSKRSMGSKFRNTGDNVSKLVANLRERVERIGRMSRALDEEKRNVEVEGLKLDDDEDGDLVGHIANNYQTKNRVLVNKLALHANGKKRVCFVADGYVTRVYDNDGDEREFSRSIPRDADEIEESTKGRQDEEEAHNDGERSSQSSEDPKSHLRDESSEHCHDQDEFTFSAPEPVKMEPRTGFVTTKPGVKIVG